MKKLFVIISALIIVILSASACGKVSSREPEPETEAAQAGEESVIFEETSPEISAWPEDSFFEVHYLDVGQGDSELVICDGEAMLIDGGGSDRSDLIYSYLKEREISHLKYIIATHPDEDHLGGLSGALNVADAEKAFSSVSEWPESRAFESFQKYLGGTEPEVPEPGTEIRLGSAKGIISGPVSWSTTSNNNSIIMKIEYGETSFLFTGDAEAEEEADVIESGANLSCTVLKVAHHGSSTSTSQEFLEAASPTYAVISCGIGNEYSHPTNQTLDRLSGAGIILFRTDIQGHIVCKSDGKNFSFSVQKNPDADTYITYDELNTQKTSFETASLEQEGLLYILNTNSRIVHVPTCESVAKMAEHNRKEVYGTLEQILEDNQGYRPCQICRAMY